MTIPTLPQITIPINKAIFPGEADALIAALNAWTTAANATAVAMNLNATTDTSASSVLIGSGSKSFTVTAGKSFVPGMWLSLADTADPSTNSMVGQVTSYGGTALVVNVPTNAFFGSGTKTAWTISLTSALSTGISAAMAPVASAVTLADGRAALGVPEGIGKNKLINPNFAVNQRAVSGTVVLAAGAYGHDRFKAGAGGCTYTFAMSLNVTTITISAGTLMQIIEGVNLFSGTHTLSWVGTATARIDTGAYSASGVTGTAVGGTNQTCEWSTGTVSKVQYEEGAFATTLEKRLDTQEKLLCELYFQKTYDEGVAPGAATRAGLITAVSSTGGGGYGGSFNLQSPMRVAPTFSYWDGAGNASRVSYYTSSWVDNNAWLTVLTLSTKSINASYSVTISAATMLHYTASAEI